jgi:hypothetical protein
LASSMEHSTMTTPYGKRPDVNDWGIIGENAALREINTADPIDLERYWETNKSVADGLMVDNIETYDELIENAQGNGPLIGYTLAISGIAGEETGEFQGFVQFTPDPEINGIREKIEQTGLFQFQRDVVIWEVSYARYPHSAGGQVASAVRQGCVLLLNMLMRNESYPRIAIIACVGPDENPGSVRVLASACFEPLGSLVDEPAGIIRYTDLATSLDSVWLLNWNALNRKLRDKAQPHLDRHR